MCKRALIFAAIVLTIFLLPMLAGAATEEVSPSPHALGHVFAIPLAAAFAGLVIAGVLLGRRSAVGSLG